jgi:hypothetical protein
MRKYLYLVLALVGLGLILAIPSRAASSSLNIALSDINSGFVYPQQWDILAINFTLKPSSNDVLNTVTVGNIGLAPYTYLSEVRLYADDGDGIFEGWQQDTDLGIAAFTPNYMSQYMWYWKDLNVNVPSEGKRFFVTVKIVQDYNLISDRQTVLLILSALNDKNNDGIFDPLDDAGIFMTSKNNGPQNDILSNGIYTIVKTNFDTFAPVSVIKTPIVNAQLSSKQVLITGYAQDQGGGNVDKVDITIKNEIGNILVDKAAATITDPSTGKWEYAYTFTANGKYTVLSQGLDGNSNLETPGYSISFNIGAAVIPPVVPPVIPPTAGFAFGDLIKASGPAVYYYGNDAKRYVFPNLNTYNSWYADFSTVKTITDTELASIVVGGNVTYKPGVKLVKIDSDPKVYAVDHGGTLRWVTTEALAISLYGANWAGLVQDVAVTQFLIYPKGSDINTTADYSPLAVRTAATSINVDKGL